MYDQLPALLQLQEVDEEIDKLERIKAEIPVKLRSSEAELEKYRSKFQAKNDTLEEQQKERRSKDRQLSAQQAQLEKYKSQRLSVKTNQEYTALESEIAAMEKANSAIEDEILEFMILIDGATDEIEVARKELKVQEDVYNSEKSEILAQIEELEKQIAKCRKGRKRHLGKIDPALMRRYDSWRKRRGSSLVAVIEGQSCGGCHLRLPPQLVNEVRKGEKLYTCNSCGRILYWGDEKKKAKARIQVEA